MILHLFGGGAQPCEDFADGDDSGEVNVTDVIPTFSPTSSRGAGSPAPPGWLRPYPERLRGIWRQSYAVSGSRSPGSPAAGTSGPPRRRGGSRGSRPVDGRPPVISLPIELETEMLVGGDELRPVLHRGRARRHLRGDRRPPPAFLLDEDPGLVERPARPGFIVGRGRRGSTEAGAGARARASFEPCAA